MLASGVRPRQHNSLLLHCTSDAARLGVQFWGIFTLVSQPLGDICSILPKTGCSIPTDPHLHFQAEHPPVVRFARLLIA